MRVSVWRGTWRKIALGPAEGLSEEAMVQRRASSPLCSQGHRVDLGGRSVRLCMCPRMQVSRRVSAQALCVRAHVSESLSTLALLPEGYVCGGWHSPDVRFQVCDEPSAHGTQGASRLGKRCSLTRLSPPGTTCPGAGVQGGGTGRAGRVVEVPPGRLRWSASRRERAQSCPSGPLHPNQALSAVSTAGPHLLGWDEP